MKVLYVSSDDDYAALEFEDAYRGTAISEIIANPKAFESDDELWTLEVMEFEEVDPKFIEFVRNRIQDYDESKHHNFYLETETLS